MRIPKANAYILGVAYVKELEPRLCEPARCPNIQLVDERRAQLFSQEKKYRIPENLIWHLCGFPGGTSCAALLTIF
jgi:hypothetical protein